MTESPMRAAARREGSVDMLETLAHEPSAHP